MTYFRSVKDLEEALRVPILLRADADARFLERQDRLSGYAADVLASGRLYSRLLHALFHTRTGVSLAGQAIWVTGPWGSLAHLPWVIGLADHSARAGVTAYLAEWDPAGLFRSMIPESGLAVEGEIPAALARVGDWTSPVSTDLAGVRVLLPARPGEPRAKPVEEGRPWSLILADTLPESLDGPYPSAEGLAGVVLVAAYRDHTRYELEACAARLRDTGHRLIGLIAIGPEEAAEPLPQPPVFAREADRPLMETRPLPVFPPPEAPKPAPPVRTPEWSPPPPPPPSPPPSAQFTPSPPAPPPPSAPLTPPPPQEPTPEPPVPFEPAAPPIAPPEVEAPAVQEPVPLMTLWHERGQRHARARRAAKAVAFAGVTVGLLGVLYILFFRTLLQNYRTPVGAIPTSPADSLASGAADQGTTGEEAVSRYPGLAETRPETAGAPAREPAGTFRLPDRVPEEFEERAAPTERFVPPAVSPRQESRPGFAREESLRLANGDTVVRAPAAPAARYVLYFSSFREKVRADSAVAGLRGSGLPARSMPVIVPGQGAWYRVVMGQYTSAAEAESVGRGLIGTLLQEGSGAPTIAVAGEGGRGEPLLINAAFPDSADTNRRIEVVR